MKLTDQQIKELSELYWDGSIPSSEIGETYGMASSQVHRYALPLVVPEVPCPNCNGPSCFRSKSARENADFSCHQGCGHTGIWRTCTCSHCQRVRTRVAEREREQQRLEQERREAEAWAAYEQLVEETGSETYLRAVLEKTTRKDREMLLAYFDYIAGGYQRDDDDQTGWLTLCRKAGVVSHKKYVRRLKKLGLLLQSPRAIALHPRLQRDWVVVPTNVRKVSKGTRFRVFQRDGHACVFCGRKPPDVELVIDHLLPVARGGTDDFDNLVTACEPCNSGKSDKLINEVRGVDLETWREHIRVARNAVIEQRRERAEEVFARWDSLFRRTSRWEEANLERWVDVVARH